MTPVGTASSAEAAKAYGGSGGGGRREEWVCEPPAGELERVRQYIQEHGIRYVVFDMDLTVTAEHSGGMLLKCDMFTLQGYIEGVKSTHALPVMRLCSELGVRMGVATFQKEVDDAAHVGGTPLVRQLLHKVGAATFIDDASIVALDRDEYKVMVMTQDTYNKNDMLRRLFAQWKVDFDPSRTVLVDDTVRNIRAFNSIGGHGIAVHGGKGMHLNNVTYCSPAAAAHAAS